MPDSELATHPRLAAESESLTDRTARAARWRFAASGTGAVAQFAVGVLLARLLTPADFGVMALAFVVLGLTSLFGDLGVGQALVQRKALTERHIRAGFTMSVLLGLGLTLACVAVAPLAAHIVRDDKVTPILQVLSLGFAFRGLSGVAGALLRRRLEFRQPFFIETGSYLLSYAGLAVTMALTGYGVWSLVWAGLSQTILNSIGLLIAERHAMQPLLAKRELHDLLRFGIGTSVSAWINYLALNGDNFVVGRSLGAVNLGLYNRAYTLMNLPFTYAANVMSGVLFPAFAHVQDDPERLQRGYLIMSQVTAMIAGPAMATLGIAAPHLVYTLFGPQWTGVVAPLQVLCLAGYFRALYHLGGIVVQSVGWVYSEMRNQAIYATLVIVASAIGARYGLVWVAAGVSVAILFMFVASVRLALLATGTSWWQYFRVQIDAIVTAVVTLVVVVAVRFALESQAASSLVIAVAIGLAAAVPWGFGARRMLRKPDLEPVKSRLPRWLT